MSAAVTTQAYEVTARDRRARSSTAAAYVVQGLCFAAVLTRVPALKDRFGFSDGELSLILLAVPVVAGAGSVLAGALAASLGSARVLRIAGPAVCAAMLAVGAAGTRPLLFLAVAAFGLVIGAVDATMNMQGVAVQRRYGRSLLMSFHGAWSIAGIASSLATAGSERIELPLAAGIAPVSVVGVVVGLVAGPSLLRRDEKGPSPRRRATLPPPPAHPRAHPPEQTRPCRCRGARSSSSASPSRSTTSPTRRPPTGARSTCATPWTAAGVSPRSGSART